MAVDYVELAAAAFGCSKNVLLSYKENPDTVVVILPSGQKHKLTKEYLLAFEAEREAAELPAVKPAAKSPRSRKVASKKT